MERRQTGEWSCLQSANCAHAAIAAECWPMRADDPKELSFFRDRSRIDKGGTGWIVRTREGTRGPFAT